MSVRRSASGDGRRPLASSSRQDEGIDRPDRRSRARDRREARAGRSAAATTSRSPPACRRRSGTGRSGSCPRRPRRRSTRRALLLGIRQRRLRRHLVPLDTLPEQALVRLARHEDDSLLSAGPGPLAEDRSSPPFLSVALWHPRQFLASSGAIVRSNSAPAAGFPSWRSGREASPACPIWDAAANASRNPSPRSLRSP